LFKQSHRRANKTPQANLHAASLFDVSVRKALETLIRSVRLTVRVFASAEEFLNSAPPLKPDCLILDVNLPGMRSLTCSSQ